MPRTISTPRPGRRDIPVTFTELVASPGCDATSLVDVAAELDLSKGAILHHYYGSKERLLRLMSLEYTLAIELAGRLTQANLARCVEIARLPDVVRGYEHIKLAGVEEYRRRLAAAPAEL